jgi:hypothetical protein
MISKLYGFAIGLMVLSAGLTAGLTGGSAAFGSDRMNPLFSYTHLLPSPFTLPAGRLALGTGVAYGITDFLQVDTNLLADIYKFYNAEAKLALVDAPEFALALNVGYENFNYRDIDPTNPDVRVSSWLPGVVTAYEILPRLAMFTGANLNFTKTNIDNSGVRTSGYVTGARAEQDVSWAYNPPSGKHSVGNVLSGGLSYDFTYHIYGVGFSHHWPGFHVGIHYYPNADKYRVQPILSGGAVIDI